ncbi:MAG: FAD-dependent thymidylate synthase [Patescibacteria group bacterium]
MPEEIIGALSSRYSRSTKSLRRLFLDEYIRPMMHPEETSEWAHESSIERQSRLKVKDNLYKLIEFLNLRGDLDSVLNVRKGREFFEKWLALYGDDSIAEMGNIHICIEGVSNIATNVIESQRVGISPIEKSSRYVSFAEKRGDSQYQFVIPEIKDTKLREEYMELMNELFSLYERLSPLYLEYIKDKYPKGSDETDASFSSSRSSKRFDDLRDILPFSTQTSLALNCNGRALEGLLNKMLASDNEEVVTIADKIVQEVSKVAPSFIKRVKTKRGEEVQSYRRGIRGVSRISLSNLYLDKSESGEKSNHFVTLVDSTSNAERKVLVSYLYGDNSIGISYGDVLRKVTNLSDSEVSKIFKALFDKREQQSYTSIDGNKIKREVVRFRKVPRAFEAASYSFSVIARGGDFRDLHRHRQLTSQRSIFTTSLGYDFDQDVIDSPFFEDIQKVFSKVDSLYKKLYLESPESAQYAVPYGYMQEWYMNATAREIFWMVELRTGPQGRPHYREVMQQMAKIVKDKHPSLFSGLHCDFSDYHIARRESEIKIANRMNKIEGK